MKRYILFPIIRKYSKLVVYLHNKNQQDALFYSQFILIINFYMFSSMFTVPHQEELHPDLLAASQHKSMTHTNCCVYRKVPPDDDQ
jgi:hypothetical protein